MSRTAIFPYTRTHTHTRARAACVFNCHVLFSSRTPQGDDVCRAVWLQDTGSQPRPQSEERDTGQATGGMGEVAEEALGAGEGFMPYPLRAAAILEDAYQVGGSTLTRKINPVVVWQDRNSKYTSYSFV